MLGPGARGAKARQPCPCWSDRADRGPGRDYRCSGTGLPLARMASDDDGPRSSSRLPGGQRPGRRRCLPIDLVPVDNGSSAGPDRGTGFKERGSGQPCLRPSTPGAPDGRRTRRWPRGTGSVDIASGPVAFQHTPSSHLGSHLALGLTRLLKLDAGRCQRRPPRASTTSLLGAKPAHSE